MTNFRGNIDNWIRQSDPDYYMLFVKAWIPFNAWYVAEMPDLKKNDRLLIKELQDNPNSRPKLTIESLLRNQGLDSNNFKYHLALLHYHLEKKSLQHNKKRLSFTDIELTKNPIKHKSDTDLLGFKYKAEVKTDFYEAIVVDKSNKTICNYRNSQYDLNDFKHSIHFIGLSNKKVQEKIQNCFEAINPNKSINLVSTSKDKNEFILLNQQLNIKFINDVESIAKSSIQVMYALRCMLFHGELDPINANSVIYEHGYQILKYIIKEIN